MFTEPSDSGTPGTGGSEQTAVTITAQMVQAIATAINSVKAFNNGTGYAAPNALDGAKETIATAIGGQVANISTITATQQNITITTTELNINNTTGVVANAAVNSITLKAIVENNNTIKLTNNASGNIWTQAS